MRCLILLLIKDFMIAISDVKKRTLKWLHTILIIPVVCGPLFIFNFVAKHITFKQIGHFDSSQYEHREVFLEQIAANKIILELNDVLYEVMDGLWLIVF